MIPKQLYQSLKHEGTYTKTDLSFYTQLTSGRISAALTQKTPDQLLPLFSLIEDKDSSVGSEVEKRISTIENRFYTHALGKEYNESIEAIILASLDASIYGVGLVELYLDGNNNLSFKRIDKEFYFYEEGTLLLSINGKKFEPKPPRFFLFHRKPLLIKLLWIVYAKHFVLSHFLKFTEFLGIPPLIANASSSDSETLESIAEALSRLKSGDFAVLGKEDTLKVLEGRGNQADFLTFVSYCDAEISKVINGNVLSSNVGDTGSLAMAKVHEDQRLEIVGKDIKYAQRCVNKTFAAIGLDCNLTIQYETDTDLYQRAQTLQILYGMGAEMSIEDLSREFDLPLQKKGGLGQNARFYRSENSMGKPLDKIDAALSSSAFKNMLNQNQIQIKKELETIVEKATNFEEAFEALLQAYPDTSMDELEEAFIATLFNSDLEGRFSEDG